MPAAEAWRVVAHAAVGVQEAGQRRLGDVTLTGLQVAGAARARAILERYGGAVVADSVGMGKTYVALQLITETVLSSAGSVLVVVPATLRRKWRHALRAAGCDPREKDRDSAGDQPVGLTSHTLLHRATLSATALVVVDEAHQFRNPRTARYRALARLTVQARVLLLTATPINNRPADLYWLLRLFLGDGALADAGVPDLRTALGGDDHHELAQRIVERVIVRRTRADLPPGARALGTVRFPRQHAPQPVRYAMPARVAQASETITELRLGAFDVDRRARTTSSPHPPLSLGAPTAALVRIGLLKRLESSIPAFRTSVTRLLRFLLGFEEAVRCGGYLRPRDTHTRDPLQLSLTGVLARPLPRACDAAELLADAQADRQTLERLLGRVEPGARDAKAEALRALLDSLGDESRVVFTEFADTASALFDALPKDGIALLHGSRAAVASGTVSRQIVLERFAPRAHGVSAPPPHERIRTLIATDVLAEGLDLQDAPHCISYDLPWNPVRLMQRAGRIDRLGSLHDDVHVWYFEPAAELEQLLGLMRRLGAKVHSIARTVGAEHGVIAADDATPASSVPAAASPAAGSADTDRLRRLLRSELFSNAPNEAGHIPAGHTQTSAVSCPVLLLCWKTQRSRWADGFALHASQTVPLPAAETIRLLASVQPLPRSTPVGTRAARAALRQALTTLRAQPAPDRPAGSAIELRTADALRHALARSPGGPDPRLCKRVDRILHELRSGLPLGAAMELRRLLRNAGSLSAPDLCTAIEATLPRGGRRSRTARAQLCAVLLLEPPSA